MRIEKSLYFGILALMLMLPAAAAFGVSTPYWKENPLIMQPGETKEVSLNLQNMVGNEDLNVRVDLLAGQEIAKITDVSMIYPVRMGTADTYVHMTISVPKNATIGTKYTLTTSFATVASGQSSGVKIGTGMEKSFDVIVGEIKENPSPVSNTAIAAIVAIIIIMAIILLAKKKRK